MTDFLYTQADAHQWATFSGDFNPIHFGAPSHDGARQMANSVHGMRALLDVKQALANGGSASCDTPWWRFSARLITPLRCDRPCRLATESQGARFTARLVDGETDVVCIAARLAGCEAPSWSMESEQNGRIEAAQLQEWTKTCPGLSFTGVWQWAFLDAALFRTLLNSGAISTALRPFLPGVATDPLRALFEHFVVVQTHHETLFQQRVLRNALLTGISWRVLPALLVGTIDRGVICELTIVGDDDEGPLISSSITLKTLPERK